MNTYYPLRALEARTPVRHWNNTAKWQRWITRAVGPAEALVERARIQNLPKGSEWRIVEIDWLGGKRSRRVIETHLV